MFSFYNLLNPSSKKAYYDEHQEQIQNARAAKPAGASGENIYLKYPNRQNKNIQLRDASSTAISPTPRQTVDGETKEKILAVCKNQKQYVERTLNALLDKSEENASTICDYIIAEQNEINIKESTKEGKIKVLADMLKYLNHKKFKKRK